MKKSVLISIVLISVLLLASFVMADNETETADECEDDSDCDFGEICDLGECVVDDDDETAPADDDSATTINIDTANENQKVQAAYDCVNNKLKDSCSTSLEDNIFALLAVGKCKSEVLAESNNEECWPKSSCNIKTTSQAVLALEERKVSTKEAKDWLLSKRTRPSDVIWYLQIESEESTTCKITYVDADGNEGQVYSTSISEEKKLSSGAGSCLTLSQGNWWLRISESCHDYKFEVSCDKGFLTNLLYKRQGSSTVYVSEETNSALAEGTTSEKVNSYCFTTNSGTCDYEGTLWAAFAMEAIGEDVSPYLPYLSTMSEENKDYLPAAFLYHLTQSTDFRTDLLESQKAGKYWDESDNKFFDTALALWPFQYESPVELQNSKAWLLEKGVQDKDGCFNGGNIRDTSFILFSLWPKRVETGNSAADCEDSGYFCMASIDCKGEILESFYCSVPSKCCDTEKILSSCSNQGGTICDSGKSCVGGTVLESSDSGICCYGGTCQAQQQSFNCASNGGTCRIGSCNSGEEEDTSYTCEMGDPCCFPSSDPSTGSLAWLWITLLILLIILVVLAIIFREKLRPYWFQIKSKFSKGKGSNSNKGNFPPRGPGPGRLFPQTPSSKIPMMRGAPRRILPPNQNRNNFPNRNQPNTRIGRKASSEMDEVLKKLKDMHK